jgi:two-component system chemotaxis response regulator CheY
VASKILVVDDAQFMRMMLKNILTSNGYEIAGEAENGVQGIAKFKELKPDLVIMDLIMPEMGGIDAAKEMIKEDPEARILMCSAMGQQALVVEAIQVGAKDFIVKPFQPSGVLEAVAKALQA